MKVSTGSLVSACCTPVWADSSAKKPNVVLLLIDDMGWKDLGCYGAKLYETPNIDALCAKGVRFPAAYTSTAICAPARATLMTGKHPMKLQMWNHEHFIPKGEKILARYLHDAGYQTWHVGKWHMGNPDHKTMPTDLGFDVNIGGWISWGPGSYFWPYGVKGYRNGKPLGRQRTMVPGLQESGKKGEYLTDRLTDEALKLIENRDKSRPLFLNFWHYAVHTKHEGKPELVRKYREKIKKLDLEPTYRIDPATGSKLLTSETNAVYAAMVESVDQSVGCVVQKLKEEGLYNNTLFIFYSDNGCTTNTVPCAPLNGGKNSTYEGGVRLPGFAVWDGHIKGNTCYEKPVYIADIFDTVLDAAGVKKPEGYDGDGMTLLPVFKGETLPPRKFVWYFPDTRKHWAQRANAAIYDEKSSLKYIMFFDGSPDEMYDIEKDIAESKNIVESNRKKADALQVELVEFLKRYYPKMPPPPKQYKKEVRKKLGL